MKKSIQITIQKATNAAKAKPYGMLSGQSRYITHRITKQRSDPYILRPYQEDYILNHALKNNYQLAVLPTGAGKSLLMMTYAAERLKHRLSTIILVPKLGIATGFEKYVDRDFNVKCNGHSAMIRAIGSTNLNPKDQKIETIIKKLTRRNDNGCLLVCAYPSFIRAYRQLSNAVKERLAIILDEAHHGAISDGFAMGTKMGAVIRDACKDRIPVHEYTATDFRADGLSNVPDCVDFKVYRRTLLQHYQEGCCPDFGFYFKFYDNLLIKKYQAMENRGLKDEVKIGSITKLLTAYLDEYKQHQLPTLMVIPQYIRGAYWDTEYKNSKGKTNSASVAKALHDMLLAKYPKLRILNLGSEDGVTYESNKYDIRDKYAKLATEKFDVVISIKVADEGIDWEDCAQVFHPRVPGTLGLIYQRNGRAFRLKRDPNHPSPNYSRIVFFELGIQQKDKFEVCPALFKLAVRMKALYFGLDWTQPFEFSVPKKLRDEINKSYSKLNSHFQAKINEEIAKLSEENKGSSGDLIRAAGEVYARYGFEIPPIAVIEKLITGGHIEKTKAMVKRISSIKSDVLAYTDFDEFMDNADVTKALEKVKVSGISEFVNVLGGGNNPISEVDNAICEYLNKDWLENYRQLVKWLKENNSPRSARGKRVRWPSKYAAVGSLEKTLHMWCHRQRMAKKGKNSLKLTQERINLLDEIGMQWETDWNDIWYIYFEEVKGFLNENGRWPKKGERLYVWCQVQRCNKQLSDERKDLLNKIGFVWNIRDNRWITTYTEVKKFVTDKKRWPLVSSDDSTESRLGVWCRMQRSGRKGKGIGCKSTDGRVKLLNQINFEWDLGSDSIWAKRFASVKEYKLVHNSWPPHKSKLGQWCSKQQDARLGQGLGKMTDERISKLDSIGFIWKRRKIQSWDSIYNKVKKFYNKYKRWPTPATDVILSRWCCKQKQDFRKNKLSNDKIKKLANIGFNIEVLNKDQIWMKNFDKLKKFISKYNRWPSNNYKGDVTEEQKLGSWCNTQRMSCRGSNRGVISEKQIRLLNSINFVWNIRTESVLDDKWMNTYKEISVFIRRNDRWPSHGSRNSHEAKLGRWCHTQRHTRKGAKRGKITPERIRLLDKIGFRW